MNNLIKSIQLDNHISKSFYWSFALVYMIAIFIAVLAKIPLVILALVSVISAPFVGVNFLINERNNLGKLYGTLPLGRSEVVTGKYLFALCFGIINEIIAGALAYGLSLVTNNAIPYLGFLAAATAAFLYFCLYISIQFPLYFHIPISKIYIFSNVPMYLIIVISEYVYRRTTFLSSINQTIQKFSSNPNLIWVTGIIAGLILVIISSSISRVIYKNKEL